MSVKINGDEEKTTSTAVSLAITCSDADLTDYQMKIWGTATAPEEADAVWESYQEEKNVTLSSSKTRMRCRYLLHPSEVAKTNWGFVLTISKLI